MSQPRQYFTDAEIEWEERLLSELKQSIERAVELATERWGRGYAYDYLMGTIDRLCGDKTQASVGEPAHHRKPIPATVRQAVYERDAYRCQHCGGWESLSVDHIHPVSLGGSNDPGNLQTLCRSCNSKKGARV